MKRDFKSNILLWIISGATTIFAAILVIFLPSFWGAAIPILGYMYFFLATIPIQGITGVKFRSQHVMSRNYLLSLPINRKQQFTIIQLRALVYWIPLILVALALPFILPRENFKGMQQINLLLYPMLLMSSIVWMINSFIRMEITTEEITSYQTQKQRFIRWAGTIILFLIEMAVVIFSWFEFFMHKGLSDYAIVIVVIGLAVWRYQAARKSWLYQQ
jgi:predicted permease